MPGRYNLAVLFLLKALGHCTRIKFSIYVHQTLMDTKCEQFYA